MNLERWSELMAAFGFVANEGTFRSLVAAYSEKHRHYHTLEHIRACLQHLDICAAQTNERKEVELALWFHDAIYRPLSGKNEQKSADWATSFLLSNFSRQDMAARVHRLVMVTEHNAPTKTKDESILVDIDLSILGSDADTYDTFEKAIRMEYQTIPMFMYRKRRVEVLSGFLRRPCIYQNEPFQSEREQQARVNLSNAISKLSAHG
jgi:predicted metal-dependent HD superfamily phosphohydrolase